MTPPPIAVFDYGGVLTLPVRSSITTWLTHDRIEPASLTELLRAWLSRDAADNPLHRLERGEIAVSDFCVEMAARLRTTDGSTVRPEGLLDRFFAGLQLDEQMLDLVRALRAGGVRTVLLSNSWGPDYPWPLIDELFEIAVISSQVGMRKPDPAIFALTAERAGVPLDRMVFIDDGAPNVSGALALGIDAHLHTDARATRQVLAAAFPSALGRASDDRG